MTLKIDDYRKEQARIKWHQDAEAAWKVFVAAYPAYGNEAIKQFMLSDDDYWHGDTPDTQGLLESIPYHETAGHFRALPDEWVEQQQLRDAQEAEEARKQRKGVLIREILGLSVEHMSETSYAFLQQKLPLMNIDELEAELKEVIERREMSGMSKEALHKGIKKVYAPIPSIRQIPPEIDASTIKRMSVEQIKQLNRVYGKDLVNERLGVKPRPQVGSMIRSSDR
jgi:hypothetical protein